MFNSNGILQTKSIMIKNFRIYILFFLIISIFKSQNCAINQHLIEELKLDKTQKEYFLLILYQIIDQIDISESSTEEISDIFDAAQRISCLQNNLTFNNKLLLKQILDHINHMEVNPYIFLFSLTHHLIRE